MTCSLLDVQCHISTFLASLWWLPWALWGTGLVLLLIALAKIKEIAGWPGVLGVFTILVYGFGYWRGKQGESINPIEHIDPQSPDAAPSHPKPKTAHRTEGKPIGDDWLSRVRRGDPVNK